MAPYISQYSHRQTHNLHQAWFLCLKPQENSPSQYKGLCDPCLFTEPWKQQDFFSYSTSARKSLEAFVGFNMLID